MKKIFFSCIFLGIVVSSCYQSRSNTSPVVLEKELSTAKKKKEAFETKIHSLEIALAQQEIRRIRNEIEHLQSNGVPLDLYGPFANHREKLAAIIQNIPDCASEAQHVLDQILSLITQLSDEDNH